LWPGEILAPIQANPIFRSPSASQDWARFHPVVGIGYLNEVVYVENEVLGEIGRHQDKHRSRHQPHHPPDKKDLSSTTRRCGCARM
jgi:hypothetical protein